MAVCGWLHRVNEMILAQLGVTWRWDMTTMILMIMSMISWFVLDGSYRTYTMDLFHGSTRLQVNY